MRSLDLKGYMLREGNQRRVPTLRQDHFRDAPYGVHLCGDNAQRNHSGTRAIIGLHPFSSL